MYNIQYRLLVPVRIYSFSVDGLMIVCFDGVLFFSWGLCINNGAAVAQQLNEGFFYYTEMWKTVHEILLSLTVTKIGDSSSY